MNVTQLITDAKAASPTLADLPDDKCRELLLVAFRLVRKAVNAAKEGEVPVGGLGTFRIHQGERDKEGKTVPVRRIGFQVATAPAKKATAAKKPAMKRPAAKKAAAKKAAPKQP